ncbi:sortase [Candidatus Gottesmanbacteria bacterium]|nr:sortase [Candidatus Gottesmanbacteria bacterium]
MALYSYVKVRLTRARKIASVVSVACIFSGLGILSWVLYPILSFEIFYAPKFNGLIKPIPNEVIKNSFVSDLPAILGSQITDFTKASAWFPTAVNLRIASSTTTYNLSIPKVGIDNAIVTVGGEDLTKSLIHFAGPVPGNYGNPVIFGHSTLLWFYNPKDYKTIFSKLPELKINDTFNVTVDNVSYKYKVYEMKIINPDDLSVLEQDYNSSNITLVTCVPPGTYLKRLIVKGRLETI